MKEILHSKVMIAFMIFVLGFTYIGTMQMEKLEEPEDTASFLVMNS